MGKATRCFGYADSDVRAVSKRQGFTLFELILYLVLFGILGVFAARILSAALIANMVVNHANEVQLTAQRVMNQIVERVHSAATITGASSTLNLEMAQASNNPTIIALSSGTITIKEGSSATAGLTSSSTYTTSLSFTQITNPSPSTSSVQIVMTMGYTDNNSGTAVTSTLYTL